MPCTLCTPHAESIMISETYFFPLRKENRLEIAELEIMFVNIL
jgi:hypothetical protein